MQALGSGFIHPQVPQGGAREGRKNSGASRRDLVNWYDDGGSLGEQGSGAESDLAIWEEVGDGERAEARHRSEHLNNLGTAKHEVELKGQGIIK